MKRKTLQEILEYCKKTNSLDELLKALTNNDYVEDAAGKTVKIRIYKDAEGKVKTEVLSFCDYRDINEMTLEELEKYCEELEEQYDDLEGEEPDDSDSQEYEDWEDNLSEIEDEIDSVKEKIKELKSNANN